MGSVVQKPNNGVTTRLFGRRVTIVIIISAVIAGLLFFLTQKYILKQAENRIQDLLLSHKGMHQYVQRIMHPAFYRYKKEGKMVDDFYAPELLSSSFIVRNQHSFYNEERVKSGLPEVYYKLAARNPRNPVNKADAMEEKLIEMFNEQRSVERYSEILEINNQKYLYVALPFLENQKNCMQCHDKREDAPKQLQEIYKGQGGFNEKEGYIRAIISIRAPLEQEYLNTYIIFSALLAGLASILSLFLFNTRLKRLVYKRTKSLKQEVVDRKRAEELLKENESFLNSVIENIPNMVFVKNARDLSFVRLNFAGEKLLGFSREELLGKNDYDFFPKKEADFFTEKDRMVLRDKTLVDIPEETIQTKEKGQRILHTKKIPILDEKGNATYLVGIAEDITSRKNAEREKERLEERLQQAQKMEAIGTLAGGIAHDFNNILAAILGYTEMAKDDCQRGSTVEKDLDKVLQAGNRAKDLVQRILAFSRQDKTESIPLQPVRIVNEAIKMLRPSIPTTIEINQDIVSTTGPILADPTQIHQILMNLCTNAFHAMEETGGKLDISLKEVILENEDLVHEPHVKDGTFIQLSISDSGPGIAPEIKNKIYDPYFTTKGTGKGTGMGLSIVHGIVKSYGGFITFYSELGQGTAFHVFLPVVEKDALPEIEVVDQLPVGQEKVLFVDDEKILVDMGRDMLERLGYHVTVRTSSLEALETFQNQPDQFDVVITDQTMPGMTGADIARRMLQIRPDIPIILCTGYSTIISEEEATSMGIKAFALKPLSKQDIAVLIRRVLDAK